MIIRFLSLFKYGPVIAGFLFDWHKEYDYTVCKKREMTQDDINKYEREGWSLHLLGQGSAIFRKKTIRGKWYHAVQSRRCNKS